MAPWIIVCSCYGDNFVNVADMSSTAFIEPLPVIEFVTQLLNRDVTSRPLSDSDRVKVRLSCFCLDHCYSLDRTPKSVWYFILLQLCCFALRLMLGFPFRESGQVNLYLINLLLLFFKSPEYLMQFLCDELCCQSYISLLYTCFNR